MIFLLLVFLTYTVYNQSSFENSGICCSVSNPSPIGNNTTPENNTTTLPPTVVVNNTTGGGPVPPTPSNQANLTVEFLNGMDGGMNGTGVIIGNGSKSPYGNFTVNGVGQNGTLSFDKGTEITVVALPNVTDSTYPNSYYFMKWVETDDFTAAAVQDVNTSADAAASYTFTLDADRTLYLVMCGNSMNLSFTVNDSGTGINLKKHTPPNANLFYLYVPQYIDNKTLVSIENSASPCFNTKMTGIKLPNSVSSIGSESFAMCQNLTSIIIPPNVSIIKDGTFFLCNNLSSVTLSSSLTQIEGGAFADTNLSTLTIPQNVTIISGNEYYGQGAFYNCSNLTSVTFESGSKLTKFDSWAFRDCTKLTTITIPANVTTIGNQSFYGCVNLTTVTFESSNTLGQINGSSFRNCTNLNGLEIPSSVTSVGEYAFQDCTGLTEIYFRGPQPTWGPDVFLNTAGLTVYYNSSEAVSWASYSGTKAAYTPT
ncbi:leucine-rich repeat domain-containing protein [Methanolapillus millepedarum]|uniref:leucine-rich repeat domain-containing protein n=1 Tax=Methanolapillus millepedarum TaxID=3028296 RepID=UPI0030B8FB1C